MDGRPRFHPGGRERPASELESYFFPFNVLTWNRVNGLAISDGAIHFYANSRGGAKLTVDNLLPQCY